MNGKYLEQLWEKSRKQCRQWTVYLNLCPYLLHTYIVCIYNIMPVVKWVPLKMKNIKKQQH